MSATRTYLGLEVFPMGQTHVVRGANIKGLLFYDFWKASMAGSTFLCSGKEECVYLHDLEAFVQLFIATSRHRFMQEQLSGIG